MESSIAFGGWVRVSESNSSEVRLPEIENGPPRQRVYTISVLREALSQWDPATYLAYQVRDNLQAARTATEASPVSSAEPHSKAPAVMDCAADSGYLHGSLRSRHRPWEIEPNDFSLPEWREWVWKLLFAMPDNALPKPSEQPAAGAAPCTCSKAASPTPPDCSREGTQAEWQSRAADRSPVVKPCPSAVGRWPWQPKPEESELD